MDLNYNLIFLQDYLKTLFKCILTNKGRNELKILLTDLMDGRESKVINSVIQTRLNNYSPETIKLIIEKNVVLSLENSVVNINKTYWGKLKDIYPNISKNFIILYFDKYIDFLKNPTDYHTKNIENLNTTYDFAIKKSMKLNTNFEEIINTTSNINLDHMNNLNGNGRTISIGNNKKGGIFLSKDSNINYGKFINKDEFINNIKSFSSKYKVITKKGKISNEELQKIVNNIKQTINVSDNEKIKNQNSKIITDTQLNKKAGNLFLGNKGIDLPNGEYISVDELTGAINNYIRERDKTKEKFKIVKRKGVLKKAIAATLVAMSLLTVKVEALDKNVKSKIQTDEINDYDLKMVENIKKDTIVKSNFVNVIDKNNVETIVSSNSNKVESLAENKVEEVMKSKNEIEETGSSQLESKKIVQMEESNNDEVELSEIVEEVKEVEEQNTEDIMITENNIQEQSIEKQVVELSASDEVNITNDNIVEEEVNNNYAEGTEEISGQDVIDYALQFVGNDYVYGGTSLTNGTDCSGFTQKIYSNFGVQIPRTSYEQIHVGENIGIDLENALPGDLLCFNGHVGIYMGNGQMVHADNVRNGININNVYYDKNKILKAIIRFDEINKEEVSEKTK